MKIKINTYEDFLNINYTIFNKIVDEDFDIYTEQEIKNIGIFMMKFNNKLFQLTQYNDVETLINENIILSKTQLLNMSYKNILKLYKFGEN